MTARRLAIALVWTAIIASGCASSPNVPVVTTPKYPNYPEPAIPAAMQVPAELRQRHDFGWRRLQSGDLRGAARDFQFVLKQVPTFVPSMTGLGFVALADRSFKNAAAQFTAAVEHNDAYLPAWIGRAEAEIELGDDAEAIGALERILQLDPMREGVRVRLELVRFRRVQALVEAGQKSRAAGRLPEARRMLGEALTLSPSSAAIVQELVLVEQQAGNLEQAESHARRLVNLEPGDAEHQALLAGILEAREKFADAAIAYSRAAALDPSGPWRDKAQSLRDRAAVAALPDAVRTLASAATVSRAEAAAYIGLKLGPVLDAAPRRPPEVATDVRNHWAAQWIVAVVRAGVMRIYENHTFQPETTLRRGDLAQVAVALIELAAADRSADLVRWRAARPRFADLPPTHVFYRPAALAVTAGVLSADDAGRFQPTRLVTGAELTSAVDRITQLSQRR